MRPQKGKKKIFDAAMELFETQGYFATTVEQITAKAGVSKGLVYNYFPSKEALLVGLIENTTETMNVVAETWTQQETLEASISGFLDGYFQYLASERRFLKLQLTLLLMPELQSVVRQPQQARAQLLLSIMTDWFAEWGSAEPENQARLFLAMLDGIALHYLSVYENYPLVEVKLTLLQTVNDWCRNTSVGSQP
ncbi:TetR/AcrR family transcriptional regulator [Shimia abyssi]|uniref:TetR family transcriptional regulator n=1 Tax=Shimia abyssi TaxID=1662395 RepID=A0A2P8FCY3_9RHOB|nr:TetR/AcrR family transcriptional regulator [Shimia abyssi]PSL19583.1 TetR family transcriptional regulator [Shimia abyssi]